MLKKVIAILWLSIGSIHSKAQTFAQKEKKLAIIGKKAIFSSDAKDRFDNNQLLIRDLVQLLKTPHSFQQPLDSLNMISKQYPQDSSFRILTWELQRDENYFRQFGAIQMNTKDGNLKLFPLFDISEFTTAPQDSIRDTKHWIGAIYYKIIQKEYNGKKFYTLLGLDDNDFITTKKWIDVLQFDNNGNPKFGGDFFQYQYDTIKLEPPVARFCLEYKKDAKAKLNYDEDLDKIVFEHLVSTENKPLEKMTLVPDGEYEGFEWKDGHWKHIKNIYDGDAGDHQLPIPKPTED